MSRLSRWWRRWRYNDDGILRGRDAEVFTLRMDLKSAESELERVVKDRQDLAEDYYELLGAVSMKWTGESRHDTAKRYIIEAERGNSHASKESNQ